MFLPSVHAETDQGVLLQFISENPLGILITGIESAQQDFLQCTHIPWVIDLPNETNTAEPPRLRAHIAKQNPQVKAMMDQVDNKPPNVLELDDDVLVLFNAKHNHYVTPKYYTETKPDTGKVVPTWNYSAVQVYGKLSLYYDSKTPEAGAFLAKQLRDLSQHTETSIMGYTGGDRPGPWKVDDAPDRYIELMQRNIVGIEIRVHKVQGKFKMSQEMRPGDREGVVKGFAGLGSETGTAISALVKERGELHDRKKEGAKK
ncbi:transcriptional regulator [Penicillium alfredii]|uniref:Transcriptional regulator n=1 Tax=Penicillium alfredii TaxID=1506179 RepID=A0A9W9KGD7_9EURO|nr:transcriptional regulator [Penicillium alfredii]KAJ5105480.1 transcriptional regulator [Penicillium alfredii]